MARLDAACGASHRAIIYGIEVHGARTRALNGARCHMVTENRARGAHTNVAACRIGTRVIAASAATSGARCRAEAVERAIVPASETAVVGIVACRNALVAACGVA
jgi:hypothetical protein